LVGKEVRGESEKKGLVGGKSGRQRSKRGLAGITWCKVSIVGKYRRRNAYRCLQKKGRGDSIVISGALDGGKEGLERVVGVKGQKTFGNEK